MIKKIIILIITICFCCLFCTNVYADESIDMNNWMYIMLIQNDSHTVSKYVNKNDPSIYGFCIEPGEYFNKKETYYKKKCEDEYIFKLVKVYDQYGLAIDNSQEDELEQYNYYIATQLLIWEYLTDEEYVFTKDYSSYKQELLDYLAIMDQPLLLASNEEEEIYESQVNEVITIEEDYSDYEIIADDNVEIISNDESGLTYKILEEEPEYKYIELEPIYDPLDYAYVYYSDNSQDIYCFEGYYETPQPMFLSLLTLASPIQYCELYYSKKDTNGNNIAGAEFTLYEINDTDFDQQLIFIHTNTDIDLYEAILGDYSTYSNLSIELSERYSSYLNGNFINTDQIGYLSYKIYKDESLIKEGKVYVSDDINQTNGTYKRINVLSVFKGYSEAKDVNTISDVEMNKLFYLCESEPYKGYEYVHNACKLIDTSTYTGETIEFVNSTRTYTLRLMKQSPYEVLLDGAKFKITYLDGDTYEDVYLTTGYLNIQRQGDYKYLIYRHENDTEASIVRFDSDFYSTNNCKTGKYYYYQSNDEIINDSLLKSDYVLVMKGGFLIENMPYSSSLTIEELEAPNGFMITEPIYHISPDISYSEITFRNFRVNEFNILPKKKFKLVKTCIES